MPSYCPHCNQSAFELAEAEVIGATVKYHFVQCSKCKAPVAVIEHSNVDQLIYDLEQRMTEVLRVLVSSLQKMNSRLEEIEQAIKK